MVQLEAGALGARVVIVCPWACVHAKLAENRQEGSIQMGVDGLGMEWQGVPTQIGSGMH